MITPEQLCVFLSRHDGEEVTDLKQVEKISFSGGELLEFINSLPDEPQIINPTQSRCITCKHYEVDDSLEPCNKCHNYNSWEAIK